MDAAERRDLHSVPDPFDDWNRHATAHNEARYQRSLLKRAEEWRDLRKHAEIRRIERAMDVAEAQHAWRVFTGEDDPYKGQLDDAGCPTMSEDEWVERHGSHPDPTPPAPSPENGEDAQPAELVVPPRRRGERGQPWAVRVLEANPGALIGRRRLESLLGITEHEAREAKKRHGGGQA